MFECKNCLHWEVCAFRYMSICGGIKAQDLIHECTKFKDRNVFTEVAHGLAALNPGRQGEENT